MQSLKLTFVRVKHLRVAYETGLLYSSQTWGVQSDWCQKGTISMEEEFSIIPSIPKLTDDPLASVMASQGWPAPNYRSIEPHELPADVASFFSHETSMKSHLERRYAAPVTARILAVQRVGMVYRRMVLLHVPGSASPVLLAAIGIQLNAFDDSVRRAVKKGQIPFGKVLETMAVTHRYRPLACYSFPATGRIARLLEMNELQPLFARQKAIEGSQGQVLAIATEVPARRRTGSRP